MAKFSTWNQRNIDHRDFRHSDRPEDWDDTPHKSKAIKGCKRNKGEPHVWKRVIKRYSWANWNYVILECEKCKKQNWRGNASIYPLATNEPKG